MKTHRTALVAALLSAGLIAIVLLSAARDDSTPWRIALHTLTLAAAVCAVSLPIGTSLALLLVRTDMPGRRILLLLLGLMLFMPLYLQVSGWEAGFGKLGWQTLAFGSSAQPWLVGWRAVVWIHAVAAVPWVVLIVGLGLHLAEPELEEEALLDGSSGQVFFRVTLPRAVASMTVAAIWILVVAAGEMTVTNIYQISNYAEALHSGLALGDDAWQVARRAVPLILVLVLLLVAGFLLAARLAPVSNSPNLRQPLVFRLGRWRWGSLILAGFLILLIVGVPLTNLTYSAGAATENVDGQLRRTWSLGKAAAMTFENPWQRFAEEIGWSLLIGVVAATLALFAAAPLAWRATGGGAKAAPALTITALLLAVPGPIVATAIIWILSRPQLPPLGWLYDRTIIAPVLVTTIRALPLAILVCWYGLRGVSPELLDSSAVEGAGPWEQFWRIVLPQRATALAAAWLTALAVAMGDLAATANILVMPPGIDTIARRIFGMIHFGVMDQVAGVCLALAAAFVAIGGAVICLLRRAWQHS